MFLVCPFLLISQRSPLANSQIVSALSDARGPLLSFSSPVGGKGEGVQSGLGPLVLSVIEDAEKKKKKHRQGARQFLCARRPAKKKKKKKRVVEMKGARRLRAQVQVNLRKTKKPPRRIPSFYRRPESSPDLGPEVLGKDANAGFTYPRHGGAVWGAGRGRYAPDLEFPFLSKLLSHLATRNPGNWGAIPFCCCYSWG